MGFLMALSVLGCATCEDAYYADDEVSVVFIDEDVHVGLKNWPWASFEPSPQCGLSDVSMGYEWVDQYDGTSSLLEFDVYVDGRNDATLAIALIEDGSTVESLELDVVFKAIR